MGNRFNDAMWDWFKREYGTTGALIALGGTALLFVLIICILACCIKRICKCLLCCWICEECQCSNCCCCEKKARYIDIQNLNKKKQRRGKKTPSEDIDDIENTFDEL